MIGPDTPHRAFREPWEARAFAIVVGLHRAGHFTWPEWVAVISAEVATAQAAGDPDLGDTYYRHWLAALEKLVLAKGLTEPVDITLRHIQHASKPAGHGHPARRTPIRVA